MIIYICKNKLNDKVYVGQTIKTLENRKLSHFNAHQTGKSKFYRALKSYGFDNFEWSILDTAKTTDELNQKEIYYIREYNSINEGYNMVEGGTGGYNEFAVKANRAKRKGKTWEDIYTEDGLKKMETARANLGDIGRNYFNSLAADQRIIYAKLGNKARTMKGYRHSDITKQKIGDAKRGVTNEARYGTDGAKELSNKISEATKSAMKTLDWDILMEKALEGRKKYWNNRHQEQRDRILELLKLGYTAKYIMNDINVSSPTYYKRLKEITDMGLI
jgi:group I intron endonuclease